MGLFSFFSKRYPTAERQITELEVRRLISELTVPTLQGENDKEQMIRQAILDRRRGDGKISLQQIYELLTKMKNQHQISEFDRAGIMKVLQTHFSS